MKYSLFWSIVDSGGEWSHFFAAPFDLFEKNRNLRLVVSKPRTNGKKIFVKVSSKTWVSLASLTNLYPSEFCLKTVRGPFFGLESAVVCPGQLERKVNNENENEKDFLTGHFWLYSRTSGPNGKTILLPLTSFRDHPSVSKYDISQNVLCETEPEYFCLENEHKNQSLNPSFKNCNRPLFHLFHSLHLHPLSDFDLTCQPSLKNASPAYKTAMHHPPTHALLCEIKNKNKSKNKNRHHRPITLKPFQNISSRVSLRSFRTERRHLNMLIKMGLLMGNIESNPGPEQGTQRAPQAKSSILVMSYNVRGLSDERKLRHLINYFYSKNKGKNDDFIVGLQESFIVKEGKIPYLWRGNFHLTPGNGHSCGCITLLSPHLSVVSSRNIGNRAHVLAIQKSDDTKVTYIVANLYAPNPNNEHKIDFFNEVFDCIMEFEERFSCSNTLVLGDFNLIFDDSEQRNRLHTAQEKRVASSVKELYLAMGLTDVWPGRKGFTWRRPNTEIFSTIDRILFNPELLDPSHLLTIWALSNSDHAALEVGFNLKERPQTFRSRLTRLDPSVIKNPDAKITFERELAERVSEIPQNWDPHAKLEFTKVCIRTILERLQAERKRTEKSEEDAINEELEIALEKLSSDDSNVTSRGPLIQYIEELRLKKSMLIEQKGERLAEKLGTKWYNEGEKSTRYFMRILNRAMPDNFKLILGEDGQPITEPLAIEEEIVNFYKNLYETDRVVTTTDDNTFFNEILPVSALQSQSVVKPITVDELRSTLHTCSDSAPGPDGIPYSVMGASWQVFGPILTDAWNYSLRSGKLPPHIKHRSLN